MESENSKLVKQVEELNSQIKEIKTSGKFMIYSASPFKFAFFNFIAGAFHSLGMLFGYIVVVGVLFYFLGRINLTAKLTDWIENTMSQIRWEKVMPTPDKQL